MCHQTVTREIREQFHARVKLFPNFTSIPFDYLLLWVTLHSQWLVFVMFIKLIIGRELCALKTLELKFWLKFIVFRIF